MTDSPPPDSQTQIASQEPPRSLPIFFGVFLAALVVAAICWLALPGSFKSKRATDYGDYYQPVAANLLAGRGLLTPGGAFAARFPPGHPIYLASIFWLADRAGVARESMVNIAAVVLHALGVALLWKLCSFVWGIRWATLPAVLWSLYPPALIFMPLGGSETPFIPIMIGSTILVWTAAGTNRLAWPSLIFCGIGCAVAMLLRPIAIAMPGVLALMFLYIHRSTWTNRITGAAIICVIAGLCVLPWELRMRQVIGKFEMLSTGGFPSIIDGLTYARQSEDREPLNVPPDVQQLMTDLQADFKSGKVTKQGQLAGWMLRRFAEQPATVLKLSVMKIVRCWYATDSHRFERMLMLLQLPYAALIGVGFVRAWKRRGASRDFALLVVCLAGYFWLMSSLVLSILRYMVPAIALLLAVTPAALMRSRRDPAQA